MVGDAFGGTPSIGGADDFSDGAAAGGLSFDVSDNSDSALLICRLKSNGAGNAVLQSLACYLMIKGL